MACYDCRYARDNNVKSAHCAACECCNNYVARGGKPSGGGLCTERVGLFLVVVFFGTVICWGLR